MDPLEKEELKKVVYSFLKSQVIAVISTVSAEITPEAATVMYFLDEDWSIYLFTHKDSRKLENMRINPNIALVIGTTMVAHTVQIQGIAEIIEESRSEFPLIVQRFQENKLLNRDPIFGPSKDSYVCIKIRITWLRWLAFDQMTNKEKYSVLIP